MAQAAMAALVVAARAAVDRCGPGHDATPQLHVDRRWAGLEREHELKFTASPRRQALCILRRTSMMCLPPVAFGLACSGKKSREETIFNENNKEKHGKTRKKENKPQRCERNAMRNLEATEATKIRF